MAIDRKHIRTMVRIKKSRPVIDNLSVSLDDLYRDKDEDIYTERLSWLEIELSDQLDRIKKKKYEFEENRKRDITERESNLKFIDSFFNHYNEGFNPDSQDTAAADTCFGLFAYIPELEQEIQKHEAANETSERNALKLVLNDLQRLNSISESPPAKKIALKYQKEILELKSQNLELLAKITELEVNIDNHSEDNSPTYLESLPDLIHVAISTFTECWDDLPNNMKKPSRAEILEYIQKAGVQMSQSQADAVKAISIADGENFGGKPRIEQTEAWKQKKSR